MSSKGPSRFSGPTSPPALWNYSKASIASLMGKLYESFPDSSLEQKGFREEAGAW